jgi:hypothetical protein
MRVYPGRRDRLNISELPEREINARHRNDFVGGDKN